MTLHERITAAVEKRLAVAQAAETDWVTVGVATTGEPPFAAADDIVTFIADNGPARIIRDCRRDLKVLARHRPTADIEGRGPFYNCRWCSAPVPRHCAEIRDLAEAYEIGVDDGDG
jgi:hypothetical protein